MGRVEVREVRESRSGSLGQGVSVRESRSGSLGQGVSVGESRLGSLGQGVSVRESRLGSLVWGVSVGESQSGSLGRGVSVRESLPGSFGRAGRGESVGGLGVWAGDVGQGGAPDHDNLGSHPPRLQGTWHRDRRLVAPIPGHHLSSILIRSELNRNQLNSEWMTKALRITLPPSYTKQTTAIHNGVYHVSSVYC